MTRKRSEQDGAFEHLGEWWDAALPRQRWHGRLECDDVEGARLVLNEKKRRSNSGSYDVILGLTNDGKRISLLNCFNLSESLNSVGLGRREIFGNLVLRGIHVKSKDPQLYGACAVFRDSDVWWNRRSLRARPRSRTLRKVAIRYAAPDPIVLFDDGDTKLLVYATLASLPSGPDDDGSYHLHEEVRFELLSKRRKPLSYFTETLFACRDLLSIACQSYCDVVRLEIYQDRKGYRSGSYHGIPIYRSDPKRRRRYNALFRLSDIARYRKNVFTSWLGEANQLAAMRALYMLAVHGNHFVEGRFLALCQAIEGFHFRYRKGAFMDPDRFSVEVAEPMLASIPQEIEPLLRSSMRDRVKYGYQFSLNKRLKLLFAEFEGALGAIVPNATKLIRPIVEARNHLVHDPLAGGVEGRPTRDEYLRFNFLLKMVAELCFLSVAGVPKQKTTEFFARSYAHKAQAENLFKSNL